MLQSDKMPVATQCLRCTILTVLVMLPLHEASADENGSAQYPLGVDTVLPALVPPIGTTDYYNYLIYYTADRFNDSSGRSSIPGFHLNLYGANFRLQRTWNTTFLGGTVTSQINQPVIGADIRTPFGNGNQFGFSNLQFSPIELGYRLQDNLFMLNQVQFYAPTGNYNPRRISNPATNYWSFMPTVSFSWFPTERSEAGVHLQYQFNSQNDATKYLSGQSFELEYNAGYRVLPNLIVGLNGYFYQQTTDDRQNGRVFGDGFRSRVFAIGPQIRYEYIPHEAGIVFRAQHEEFVRNRPKGDRLWIEFNLPL